MIWIYLTPMYIERRSSIYIGLYMPIQIANPAVVEKIETLAKETGLTETAAVEKAVDAALKHSNRRKEELRRRVDALLAEIDKLPRVENPIDPLQWDENGLPI